MIQDNLCETITIYYLYYLRVVFPIFCSDFKGDSKTTILLKQPCFSILQLIIYSLLFVRNVIGILILAKKNFIKI